MSLLKKLEPVDLVVLALLDRQMEFLVGSDFGGGSPIVVSFSPTKNWLDRWGDEIGSNRASYLRSLEERLVQTSLEQEAWSLLMHRLSTPLFLGPHEWFSSYLGLLCVCVQWQCRQQMVQIGRYGGGIKRYILKKR